MSVQVKSSGSSPTLQSRTVTPSSSIQYITAESNYDGLSQVTVNAVQANDYEYYEKADFSKQENVTVYRQTLKYDLFLDYYQIEGSFIKRIHYPKFVSFYKEFEVNLSDITFEDAYCYLTFPCENSITDLTKMIMVKGSYTGINYEYCYLSYARRNFYRSLTGGMGLWSTTELNTKHNAEIYSMETTSSTISFKFNLQQDSFVTNGISWIKSQTWFLQVYGLDYWP